MLNKPSKRDSNYAMLEGGSIPLIVAVHAKASMHQQILSATIIDLACTSPQQPSDAWHKERISLSLEA